MDVIILRMTPHIPGESKLRGYEQQIELLSFSHGVGQQVTGDISSSERTSGRPGHQDFTFTKYLDSASPRLQDAVIQGTPFSEVKVTIGRNDNGSVVPLITYTMKNVLITDIRVGGGGGDKPVETVTLSYEKITWDYSRRDWESAPTSWSVAAGEPGESA